MEQTVIIRRVRREPISSEDLHMVSELARKIDHGSITLVIQDGTVFQIDKTEKIRL